MVLGLTPLKPSIGIGGIKSEVQISSTMTSAIKDENYIGKRYANQFTTLTNDPSSGYWLDGLPNKIDPRAYKAFYIPGDLIPPSPIKRLLSVAESVCEFHSRLITPVNASHPGLSATVKF